VSEVKQGATKAQAKEHKIPLYSKAKHEGTDQRNPYF
jgi:hypothetical protein